MSILTKVDYLKKKLSLLLPMTLEQRAFLDKKILLELNYNSNYLEGNTFSYDESKIACFFEDNIENQIIRDSKELKGHELAYLLMTELAKDKEYPITQQQIRLWNQIILVCQFEKMSEGKKHTVYVGEYKKNNNFILQEDGTRHDFMNPEFVSAKMEELINWYCKKEQKISNKIHPVVLASFLHHRFVQIHPFDEGNGRVARLLLNYVLLKHDFPPVIIKSVDKDNYKRALNRADANQPKEFIEYISQQLIWSLNLSIKAANGENIEEPEDFDKRIAVLKRRHGSK